MKATIKLLCLVLVCTMLTGCGAPVLTLRDQGISLIALLDELAASEECVGLYSASPEINEIISNAAATHGQPKAVFAVTPASAPMQIPVGTSPELTGFLSSRGLAALVSQLNAAAGVEALAASAICTVSKTFTAQNAKNVIYLYVYEDAVPVAVTFLAGENSTVSASATYLLGDRHDLADAEDIQALFGDLKVTVEPVME